MLVGDARLAEVGLVVLLEDLIEDVLEASVVLLQDGVLGTQVQRPLLLQREVETAMREALDALVRVVHAHGHTIALEVIHVPGGGPAFLRGEGHGELSLAFDHSVGGFVLVSESVAADHDGFGPAGHQAWDVIDHDGLAEHGAAEDVADGAVGALPHLLQAELLHACLVRGDGGALDANVVLLDRLGRVHGHLIVGGIAVLNTEIVIVQGHVHVGQDQLVLDPLPDDARHLVTIDLHYRVRHLDLLHAFAIDLFYGPRRYRAALNPRKVFWSGGRPWPQAISSKLQAANL